MYRRLIAMALAANAGVGGAAALVPRDLRVEYRAEPLGISETAPRLSWIVTSETRGAAQTGYRILISSTPEGLDQDAGDLWDTGKVSSPDTAQVVYAGMPLKSRAQAWWKVRVWDQDGNPSAWSAPSRWTMGLLNPSDWSARWVQAPTADDTRARENPLDNLQWVWTTGDDATSNAPRGNRVFRRVIRLPEAAISEASFSLTADDHFRLFINGGKAGESDDAIDAWRRPETLDVGRFLKPGENIIAISARNNGGPAGLIGVLRVRSANGEATVIPIDASWRVAADAAEGWLAAAFDDSGWQNAAEVAKFGDAPWHIPGQTMTLELPPSPQLRKEFMAGNDVKNVTLTITALGLYEASINGRRVGNDILRPGWTDYRKRVYYQTYDVTDMLREGENAIGVTLADGWALGYVGLAGRNIYGVGQPRLLAQLDITNRDGARQSIGTDASWKAHYGPIKEADLLMGETYDARDETPDWDSPGFDDTGWQAASLSAPWPATLEAHPGVPVREMRTLKPISVKAAPQPPEAASRPFIYDMGQNMVGWARIKVKGAAGAKVRLRFAEMLNPDGSMYVTNLRSARNVDTYILNGDGEETWEPRFTFHGFRYLEISGLPEPLPLEDVTGVVVHSDIPDAGTLNTSNPIVNQLQHNIQWGMWGNFLEVPTDCPQRDERLGWLGDAQVFVKTATQNADVAAFFTKWMVDVEDAQRPDGAYTDVAPFVAAGAGTAAWADAGVIVPWTIYQAYNDTRILERHYASMARYIAYLEKNSDNLLRPAQGYGDWLSIGADTPKDVLGTAYFAYSTSLMAKIAAVLGKTDDAAKYEDLANRVKIAFNKAYVSPDGRIKGDTQSCYVMALKMDLLPGTLRPKAAQYLVEDIRKRGDHLSTGFIGTAYLNPVLSANGHTDTAYKLLLQDTFPGWLFSIKHGATTIWERWDGWTPDKGFQDPGMNSFNHYSFGAVDEWLYGTVAGIQSDPEKPGFRHFVIAPEPGGGLTSARAAYQSLHGEIVSDWKLDGSGFTLNVTIPANTTATVSLPTNDATITESGHPAATAKGVAFEKVGNGRAVYTVKSGTYSFRSQTE